MIQKGIDKPDISIYPLKYLEINQSGPLGIYFMNLRIPALTISAFAIISLLLCPAWAADKITVFVSIPPQKYFVQAIGKDRISATAVVSPAHSPADYEPSPAQMREMATADIYFSVGVPFETIWLEKFAAVNPAMKIVAMDRGIEKKPINRYETATASHKHAKHTHGENGHGHDHCPMDPHIWLSPPLVKIQAGHIADALSAIDPSNREYYRENCTGFLAEIDRLNNELNALFADTGTGTQKKFLVFHPSWGYFADAYNLTQFSIEIEGKAPKAREVKNLIDFARQHQIRVIFVQPQFSEKQADIIAREINGRLVPADPLAENWTDNIRSVALSIKDAVQ
jgi:zinc transport system substrate-binding protein